MKSIKATRPKKRVGRGIGSGKGGHTTGRGAKGQKIRGLVAAHFEGGQVPFYKRIPKVRRFGKNKTILELGLSRLKDLPDGQTVTASFLKSKFGLTTRKYAGVKIIDDGGKVLKKFKFIGVSLSLGAQKKVGPS